MDFTININTVVEVDGAEWISFCEYKADAVVLIGKLRSRSSASLKLLQVLGSLTLADWPVLGLNGGFLDFPSASNIFLPNHPLRILLHFLWNIVHVVSDV